MILLILLFYNKNDHSNYGPLNHLFLMIQQPEVVQAFSFVSNTRSTRRRRPPHHCRDHTIYHHYNNKDVILWKRHHSRRKNTNSRSSTTRCYFRNRGVTNHDGGRTPVSTDNRITVLYGLRSELRRRFSLSFQNIIHSFRRPKQDRTTTITIEPSITNSRVEIESIPNTPHHSAISNSTNVETFDETTTMAAVTTTTGPPIRTTVSTVTNVAPESLEQEVETDSSLSNVAVLIIPDNHTDYESNEPQSSLFTTNTPSALLENATSSATTMTTPFIEMLPLALSTENQIETYNSSIRSMTGGGRRHDGLRLHLDVIPLPDNDVTMQSLTRAKWAASQQHQPLYTVPQLSTKRRRDLTKLEWEFRNMMEHFANYSEADLLSIADPRKRTLFEGIAASSYSRPVYRAFEILYEDLLPLRYAGRLIYNKLKEFMITSIQQRQEEMELILNTTGISQLNNYNNEDDIQRISEIRLMFVTTASQLNSDSYLTLDQLAETGIITTTATEVLGLDSVDEVLHRLDKSSTGKITFVNLLLGLWELSNEYCGLEFCNPQVILHNLLVELNEQIHSSTRPLLSTDDHIQLDSNRQRYSLRYDEMVSSFIQWKHLLPPAPTYTASGNDDDDEGQHAPVAVEGRRMEIVRGCFAGAELPKVVDALRVVYVDYAALRVAGDIIYKLTAAILKNRR
jgi:hypothetical protein